MHLLDMGRGCRRLIVMFQSLGQILSSSSVFSVLCHLLCKSTKNTQHHTFWAQVITHALRHWAYLMAFPCYLAVCLLCWWDASIPAPRVSWTRNASFFYFQVSVVPGWLLCVDQQRWQQSASYLACAYAATRLSLGWPLLVANAHNCRSSVILHN